MGIYAKTKVFYFGKKICNIVLLGQQILLREV